MARRVTTRIISLAGRGVVTPGVFEVRIGTTIEALVAAGGGYTADAARLVAGGPLMGLALPHDEDRADPDQQCHPRADAGRGAPVGAGAAVYPLRRLRRLPCPVRLQPQELLRLLPATATRPVAGALGLADCIECGCCAYVCPSQIPLVDWYRSGKSALATAAAQPPPRRPCA